MEKFRIAIAEGDGIGPEIMKAVLKVLQAVQAPLEYYPVVIGEKLYHEGERAGINEAAWRGILGSHAFLKSPMTTPQGGGFKSLNVTIRAALGLFANVRPCSSFSPFIETKQPNMNIVIVRENEEDLYIGLEYQHSEEIVEATKLISHRGSEKICRYAFEFARSAGRKKVTCLVKDNILKMSDGLFHRVFKTVALEYPDIEADHWIVDIGAAKLADHPELFDVVVTPNLYGDILSDITAEIAGSVGLAGSANIGPRVSMFEAIHGSAPKRAGQDSANPSGLLMAASMMLDHLGLTHHSALIQNAWRCTIEDGIHTYDIASSYTKKRVGTQEFAKQVIERLGKSPRKIPVASQQHGKIAIFEPPLQSSQEKVVVGFDLFIPWYDEVERLIAMLQSLKPHYSLKLIASRGSIIWPKHLAPAEASDLMRCRLLLQEPVALSGEALKILMSKWPSSLPIVRSETLMMFNGVPGYTLASDEQ